MAKRTQPPQHGPAKLTTEQMRKGIAVFERRIIDLEDFNPLKAGTDEVKALQRSIDESLERVFGRESSDYERYRAASRLDNGPLTIGGYAQRDTARYWTEGRSSSIALLRQAVRGLHEMIEDGDSQPTISPATAKAEMDANRVFIVHGRDKETKLEVARFVEKLGLEPIILDEQANQGRTLIEKFEAHSNVGYAIVLLTPDDEGALKGEPMRDRARQNVVLELGFFVGRLGRGRVAALVKGDLEYPSDITGLVWTLLSGNWKYELMEELKAAGYTLSA